MTIDILSTSDISKNNEVINVPCARENDDVTLSAASYLIAKKEAHESLVTVLGFLFKLLSERFSQYNIWLFIGNSASQPDTRIVRYRKMWGALKHRGLEILGASDLQETIVSVNGGIKFFGALRLSELSIETVINVLLDERCSYIAALPEGFDFQCALNRGWSGEISEDLDYFYCLCKKHGLLLKRIGEFDDCERGFVSIALPELIRKLINLE